MVTVKRTLILAGICIVSFWLWATGPAPAAWEPLLNGRDLAGWHSADAKAVAWFAADHVATSERGITVQPATGPVLVNSSTGRAPNLVSDRKFGDVELHAEFLLPKGSNSGLYLQSLYEVQIADSYGIPRPTSHECAGLYERWIDGHGVGGTAPLVNASRPAGEWQTLDIRFQAPRFDSAGRKVADARFLEVRLNGKVVQKDVSVDGPTRASLDLPEAAENPIMLQGDHGPVAFRNFYVRPLSPVRDAAEVSWVAGAPLLGPLDRDGERYYAIKDPSLVRFEGKWHIFATLRGKVRSHQIEYLSFADWKDAGRATRAVLKVTDGFFCAPQVFYFRPDKKWYLIYQAIDKSRVPQLQPVFSTTNTIASPESWSKPAMLMDDAAKGVKSWIDFWVICDATRCHLFFTTLDGRMWRSSTGIGDFPKHWSQPAVVLRDDIYEASHTYLLKSGGGYLTFVEAIGPGGRRYFKSYRADRLDGTWRPLAAWQDRAFLSSANVRFTGERWTDSFSHGELIRDGYDETMAVDPSHLQFLIQGVRDEDRIGKPYGEIPWRLGLLESAK
jgi:hypothetical protein